MPRTDSRRTLTAAAAAIALLAVWSCSTNPHLQGVPPEEGRVRHEPDLAELLRFDEPMEIVAAAWEGATLGVHFAAGSERRFGYANRATQQALNVRAEWFPVFQVLPSDAHDFQRLAGRSLPVRTFDADQWQALRVAFAETVTPAAPGRGIVLNERDNEYFLYRDAGGELRWTDLFDKPAEVPLTASYRVEKMTGAVFATVEDWLTRRGVEERVAIFATGETGAYARPFAAVLREERRVVLFSLEPFTFGSMPNSYAIRGGKVGFHFARSYYLEAFNRPVSYVFRLVFLLSDLLIDTTRGIYLRNRGFAELDELEIPPLHEGPGMDLEAWEAELDRRFGAHSRHGRIDLLVGGDTFFPTLVDEVIGAKETVKMRTYIFDRDDYAVALADLFKRRSREVEVKITVDGLGTIMAQNKAAGTMPEEYDAPVGITAYLESDSQVKVRSFTNPWLTGDHTKTTIIDSEVAFVGGMNIGREYRWEWHDVMMEVRGPIVAAIERQFDRAYVHGAVLGDVWLAGHAMANPKPPDGEGAYPIRPLLTRPQRSQIYEAQLHAIRNARGYIFVENAYFSDTTVIYELARARLRGVDVRVIIPMEGNHGIMNLNNVVAANRLLKYGVRVFTYPGMSHIKAAVYDGWACLGSANFDKLSFRINRELNLGSSDPGFVQEVIDEIFEPDFVEAAELRGPLPETWKNSFASIVAAQL